MKKTGIKSPSNAKRGELVDSYKQARRLRNQWLKSQILDKGRVDILCQEILGYEVKPHHQKIIDIQSLHRKAMMLAFRGAGKSTIATIARAIYHILKNPNIRILIASKTSMNANDFLREIKQHFETNERLIEVFGNFVGTNRWDTQAIEVRPRTIAAKEPTINTLGVESSIVSKHYDIIIGDDLVDDENSRTPGQRERTMDFFYTTLLPCLEPPDPNRSDVGCMWVLGTRYHTEDLHKHLSKHDMRGVSYVIPAETESGKSTWPDKFPEEHLAEMKMNMGTIRWLLQMMCDDSAFQGNKFKYEWMNLYDELPLGLRIFMGVDLAISLEKESDFFAMIVLGTDFDDNIYVIDGEKVRLPFNEQIESIKRKIRIYHPIKVGVEANAYQLAMVQELKRLMPTTRFEAVYTAKDKNTRADLLSPYFESGRMWFRNGPNWIVNDLVLFPKKGTKDTFDALDIGVKQATGTTRLREEEPDLFMIG